MGFTESSTFVVDLEHVFLLCDACCEGAWMGNSWGLFRATLLEAKLGTLRA